MVMTEENKNTQEDLKQAFVDDLYEESMEELDSIANEADNDDVIDEARGQINKIFEKFKGWVNDAPDSKQVMDALKEARYEVRDVLSQTKDKVVEVSQSDNVQKTLSAGKDFLVASGELIGDGFKAANEALMKNENVANLKEKSDEKIKELRSSEKLKSFVESANDVSLKINETIFGGIRQFFDTDEDIDDDVEEMEEDA